MRYNLTDRVVLITGASSGIGRACAVAYHRAGARVVVAARSADKLESLAESLGADRVLPVTMDATIEADRDRTLALTRERFGPVDVLVNNAGWASFGSVVHLPPEHYQRMIALNLSAPLALIQAVLPEMIQRGSGQIVNIASVVGHQVIPRMTVYSATKAALIALSTGLRMELRGTGVDVLVVSPGSTRTEFFTSAAAIDAQASRLATWQQTPERVARAVVRSSKTRRREVILTAEGITIILIRRLSPRLADALINIVARRTMPPTEPK